MMSSSPDVRYLLWCVATVLGSTRGERTCPARRLRVTCNRWVFCALLVEVIQWQRLGPTSHKSGAS